MELIILVVGLLIVVVGMVVLGGWLRTLQVSIDLTHGELHAHTGAEDAHGDQEWARLAIDSEIVGLEPQFRRVHMSMETLTDIVASHDSAWTLLAAKVDTRVVAISEDHARLHGEIDALQTEVRSALGHVQQANISLREYQAGNLTELLDQITAVEARLRPVIADQAELRGELDALQDAIQTQLASSNEAIEAAAKDLRSAHREDLATIDTTLERLVGALEIVTAAQVRMDKINEDLKVLTTRVENGAGKKVMRIL